MIRNLLSTGVALAAFKHARAQEAEATTSLMSTTLAPSLTTAPFSSITPIDTADWVSYQQLAASSRSSVSSLLGPFYESVLFIPCARRGDWISAISAADGGDTTVWAVYLKEYYTDPASRYAYMNVTWGPTTYIETASWPTITLTDAQFEYEHTTMLPIEITTRCLHTSVAPKISVPDEEWQAGLWNPETMNSDHFLTYSAECNYEGQSSLRDGGVSHIVTSHTMPRESDYGWNLVTVVGEKPAVKTSSVAKGTGVSAETGSGSGTKEVQATNTQAAGASEVTAWVNAVVVVAAAAAMAI